MLVALAVTLLSLTACSPPLPPHPSIGKWRGGFLSLRVRPDRVATVNGFQCDWTTIDATTIQISPRSKIPLEESGPEVEVAFEMSVLEGGQQATLDIFGFPITVDREGGTQPASSKPVY
jgi:hypothetical protein